MQPRFSLEIQPAHWTGWGCMRTLLSRLLPRLLPRLLSPSHAFPCLLSRRLTPSRGFSHLRRRSSRTSTATGPQASSTRTPSTPSHAFPRLLTPSHAFPHLLAPSHRRAPRAQRAHRLHRPDEPARDRRRGRRGASCDPPRSNQGRLVQRGPVRERETCEKHDMDPLAAVAEGVNDYALLGNHTDPTVSGPSGVRAERGSGVGPVGVVRLVPHEATRRLNRPIRLLVNDMTALVVRCPHRLLADYSGSTDRSVEIAAPDRLIRSR